MLKLLICLQMERKRKGEREREQKKRSGVRITLGVYAVHYAIVWHLMHVVGRHMSLITFLAAARCFSANCLTCEETYLPTLAWLPGNAGIYMSVVMVTMDVCSCSSSSSLKK